MALKLHCTCGKVLIAPDGAAGKRLRCGACGATVTVPGSGKAAGAGGKEQTYGLKDEPEPKSPPMIREEAVEETPEPDEVCVKCGQDADGETYNYFVATLAGVSAKGNTRDLSILYTTSYRGVSEQHVFLCDECAAELWHAHFRGKLILSSFIAGCSLVVFVVLLAAWLVQGYTPNAVLKANNYAGIGLLFGLGGAGVVSAVAALVLGINLWYTAFPLRNEDMTDRLVVEWLRERSPRRGLTFFTTSEFVRRAGGLGEG